MGAGGGSESSGGRGGNVGPGGGPGGGGGGLPPAASAIMNTLDACERIKEEYNFLQSQNQSLKMELDKMAQEKTEMQRHYVMVNTSTSRLDCEQRSTRLPMTILFC